MTTLHFNSALLSDGWHTGVRITVGTDGLIQSIEHDVTPNADDKIINGAALPGMPNLHSHAFQRAMAGRAERAGPQDDSFWTWREVMYGFVEKLSPEDVEAIAAQLYLEMLKAGYTSVAEFHYLHHAPGGAPYDQLTEMSCRTIDAARYAGIGITHLPVLYAYGGFGGAEPAPGQARFLNGGERYLRLVQDLHDQYKDDRSVRIGIAPHSLRAVSRDLLNDVLAGASFLGKDAPVHIHIAEQAREVEECLAALGARPVEWLLDRFDVDERWCLIHATHLRTAEIYGLAASGAVAGLCPTTEANLGDGLFPAHAFLKGGGTLGVGSDSNTEVSVTAELRLLEYGQRLATRTRNVLADEPGASTGHTLFTQAARGGAQALAINAGVLETGVRADIIVLDTEHPAFAGRDGDDLIDTWIFAAPEGAITHVFIDGRHIIDSHRHPCEEAINAKFRAVIEKLV